jgi:hypothetical protein
MDITSTSSFPSITAWSRTLAYDTFQTHELLLSYLRWLDQSYGSTVTCTLHADRSATIGLHGVDRLTVKAAEHGRIYVQWMQPEPSYWDILQRTLSKPADLTKTNDGARWQFYIDSKPDTYLLRDLTTHLHK